MEEFYKKSDIEALVSVARGSIELQKELDEIKTYKAEWRPYMPIRLRDYGYRDEKGDPVEIDCGSDLSHHWLHINDEGRLEFINIQCCEGSHPDDLAEVVGGYSFIPTFTDELVGDEYITPREILVIDYDDEEDEDDETD